MTTAQQTRKLEDSVRDGLVVCRAMAMGYGGRGGVA